MTDLPTGVYVRPSSRQRFTAKVVMGGPCWNRPCWEWVGSVHPDTGYGKFWDVGRHHLAHRWSYEHFVGPIPAGHVIDHVCRNRRCVNPDHLEAVTQHENLRRIPTWGGNRDRCPKGHPLDGRKKSGRRYCKECSRQYSRTKAAA